MKNQCYNWEKNLLKLEDTQGNKFELQFNWNKTVVDGASATGKSLLTNAIKDLLYDMNISTQPYDVSNIVVIDNNKNINEIKQQENKLIIIDRGDILITNDIAQHIMNDIKNRYLIFCRKYIYLNLSPNHYAELIVNGKNITLHHEFNEESWF